MKRAIGQAPLFFVCCVATNALLISAASAQVNGPGPSPSDAFDIVLNLPGDETVITGAINESVGGVAGQTTQLNVSEGGVVGARFDANSGSEVNISGGKVGNSFSASFGSEVNISGGTLGKFFEAFPGSDVELIGGEFRLNGADFTSGTISLGEGDVFTGTLADGSSFVFSSYQGSPGKIAIFGDSLLAGVAVTNSVENSFDRIGCPVDVTRQATGGFRIDQLRASWDAYKPNCEFHDYGVLNIGINSVASGSAPTSQQMVAEYTDLVDDMLASGCFGCLILLNQSPFGNHTAWTPQNQQELIDLKTAIEAYGSNPDVTVIDTFTALADPTTWPGPQPVLDAGFERVPPGNPDGLHWNQAARDVVSDMIRDAKLPVNNPCSSLFGDGLSDVTLTLVDLPAADTNPIVLNTPPVSGPSGLRAGQELTVVEGGSLGENVSLVDATLNVEAGAVGDDAEAYNCLVNISGGTVGDDFEIVGCVVNISGGTVGVGFSAHSGSVVNIQGSAFSIDGTPLNNLQTGQPVTITDRDVTLSGVLADGKPFSFDLNPVTSPNPGDRFSPDATLTLTLVSPVILGDVNLDGVVEFSDIPAFIERLITGEFQAEADCDRSGVVDFSDIPAFIEILLNT